jgi:cation diffusion facilitator family transporter
MDRPVNAAPQRTAMISLGAAAVLVALKLGVGIATTSLSLISAGFESSGDVLAALITYFAVSVALRPADRGHPYGHRRAENLGALGEATILIFGALLIAIEAIRRLAQGASPEIRWYQFAVLAVALLVDALRIRSSSVAARELRSPALRSNAAHFAADAAGSVAVIIGLVAVRAGLHGGDSIAALVVAALTAATGLRLLGSNASVLMDSAPPEARRVAEHALAGLGPEIEVGRVRLREAAGRYFADVVVSVAPGSAVVEGHVAADRVEKALHDALPGSDVVVHVEPRTENLDLRDAALAAALGEPLVKEAHDVTVYRHGTRRSVSLHLKLPAELSLSEADAVATRVGEAICRQDGVGEVQVHLEPLEEPVRVVPERGAAHVPAQLERSAREVGVKARDWRVLETDGGLVIFLTVELEPGVGLTEAHDLASRLEEHIRSRLPGVTDVVVHTAATR